MAAKKRRKRRSSRASVAYTVSAVLLLVAVVVLALSLLGVFAPPPSRAEDLTVLVLNGCGAEGIGQRTARHLRSLGLDVIDFRNADNFDYTETLVVDRTGDLASAASVARMLGVGNVIQQIPETPLVDIIVIIGADHEQLLGD